MSIQGIEMAARARHHIRLQEIKAAQCAGQKQTNQPKFYDRLLVNLGDGMISAGLRLKKRQRARATVQVWQAG